MTGIGLEIHLLGLMFCSDLILCYKCCFFYFFDEFVIEYLAFELLLMLELMLIRNVSFVFWPYPPFSQLPAYRVRFDAPLID